MTTTTKSKTSEHDPSQPHGGVDVVDQPDQPEEDNRPRADPLDVLTIAELDAGSRQLGSSLIAQVTNHGDRYEQALAVVLWLHRRRTDRSTEPKALLRELGARTFVELSQLLDELALQLAEQREAADGPLE